MQKRTGRPFRAEHLTASFFSAPASAPGPGDEHATANIQQPTANTNVGHWLLDVGCWLFAVVGALMAWTYSNWTSQSTAAARLTRLNLHITEVSDILAKVQDGSISGQQWSRFDLPRYLEGLLKERAKLEKDASAETLGAGESRPIKVFGINFGRPT